MKKYFFLLVLAFSLVSTETIAQNWLNRMANDYRQRNQQRTTQKNSSQQIYQNRQRYEQQKRANLQRTENSENSNSVAAANSQLTYQGNDKVVSLVASGTGQTKDDATQNALRSAIEQAFGTFVSANTEVLNDDLVKDEIVTVSTGNIRAYKELSASQLSNGLYDVSVQAIVSIDQLAKFAQSKGMQAELAGASFTMNMKMRELNKKNEVAAIDHMIEKVKAIANNGLFDYKLEIGEPTLTKNSKYAIQLRILFCENANTRAFYETIDQTLQALSLTQKEQQEYNNAGLKYYGYNAQLDGIYGNYVLRSRYPVYWRGHGITRLLPIIVDNALNYEIKDNLGNVYYTMRRTIKPTTSVNPLLDYINDGKYTCEWYYIDKENEVLWFYELRPQDKIMLVSHGYDKYPAIPLMDYTNKHTGGNYNGIGTDIPFNPTIEAFGKPKRNEDSPKIYYYQEFFVSYSEEELSKLTSITINHR